ncbi:uncharacterized protein LOC131018819 [Salvia miltiorrhiza]|uniref:uncharacterized protein LOC131018819 n=1 Tax=Salvia miltiorrhiza TaxID=226208 RepID=UPI0025AC479D|nr:uncharacterized protein LOC131018819 [Salvia miltiorrhiza]
MTEEQLEDLTWKKFKAKLFEKYIPECYRQEKQNEFLNLRQRNMTVTEYDRAFNQLFRYAPHLVDTDEKRAKKFRNGLHYEISISLASQGGLTYAQTLNRALTIESLLPKEKVKTPAQFVHPQQFGQTSHSDMEKGKRNWNEGGNYGHGKKPWTGHYANTCPKKNRGAPQQYNQGYQQRNFGNPPRNPGNPLRNPVNQPRQNQGPRGNQRPPQNVRVYALNQQQAAQEQGNLTSMISILETPIMALFDTGASHSFIAYTTCKILNLVPELSKKSLKITTPGGGRMTTKHVISNLELDIVTEKLKADLYVISMIEFDIILGMDWFTRTGATIRCNERKISFQTPEKGESDFHGIKIGLPGEKRRRLMKFQLFGIIQMSFQKCYLSYHQIDD